MLKLVIVVTGILSFLHFVNPAVFSIPKQSGKVLGINNIEEFANIKTVATAVTMYCLDKQKLPENLDDLYQSELSTTAYLDLNKYFNYQKLSGCEFNLTPKNS